MTRMITNEPMQDPGSRLPELREALLSDDGLRRIARLVTMGELALCFSHEVRNPLSVMIGYATILKQSLPDAHPMHVQLDSLTRHSKRIKGMADTMLSFVRFPNKLQDWCTPNEAIQEAILFVGAYLDGFRAPSIVLKVDVECGCPKIAIDRWEMVHVFVNLLKNAADAMTDSCQRLITITAQREGRQTVRISVADTGCGIDPENVGRVFTPYFSTKHEKGNGLGLYIVRNTIEEYKGTITVQTGSEGTVFTICLPIA
jgi:signal transduction histidine kinase